MMNAPLAIVLLLMLLVCAVWHDQKSRRIPNVLVLAGITASFMLAAYTGGWTGLGKSIAGALVGLVVMLPVYALRYIGAGDVKLISMVGAFVGPLQVGVAILYTAVAGGVLALLAICIKRFAPWHQGHSELITEAGTQRRSLASKSKIRLPYAWAVLCGTVISQWIPLR